MVLLGLLVPALWFLPELWGSGQLWRSAQRAEQPDAGTALTTAHPALTALRRGVGTVSLPVWAAAGLALLTSPPGRRRVEWTLGATVVAAVLLVAAMTGLGFPGLPRFLLAAQAVAAVLAGVGVARVVGRLPRRVVPAAAVALVVLSVPAAVVKARHLHPVLAGLRQQAGLDDALRTAVDRAGGPHRLLACGLPSTVADQVAAVAWSLDVATARVADRDVGTGARIVPNAGGGWDVVLRCAPR